MQNKEFFFEVRGKITAKNEMEATDYLWELLNEKVENFEVTHLEEGNETKYSLF
jgi:hypothetical protein